jgi:hypothetical protein
LVSAAADVNIDDALSCLQDASLAPDVIAQRRRKAGTVSCDRYVNASLTAAANATVRMAVPDGQAVIISGCTSRGLWGVRVVLGLGVDSWAWLSGWDVELGGVTIESLRGGTAALENATVVVDRASLIVARSSPATHPTSEEVNDVHAVSVVGPGAVHGFALLVTEGSVLNATHDGPTYLHATAATVHAANRSATPFSGSQVRIVLRRATAAALSKGSTYDAAAPRRACVAAVHLPAGSSALLSDVLVSATDGSSLHVLGDSGVAALGLVVRALSRGTSGALAALEVDGFVAVAIGSSVDVRTTVHGEGSSAMGIVTAFRGATCVTRRVVMFAARSNVTVQVAGYGYGTATLALAIYASSFLSADNTLIYAIESNVTVTCGSGGYGVGVLGVANYDGSTAVAAACSNFSVYSESSAVAVNVGVNAGGSL